MDRLFSILNSFFFIVGLLFLKVSGISQDTLKNKPTGLAELLNTKVVLATRTEQSVSETPANVIVITSEQIENRGYLTIEDVLKDLPGFDFSTGQPAGEYPTHFLQRGVGSVGQTKVALLIDGISQNDVSNGWIRLIGYNFTLTDIDRIEVVSGPGSSLYGGNAHVGYINIITKSAINNESNRLQTKVNLLGGTNNTIAPELLISHKAKNGLTFQLASRYYYSLGDNGQGRLDPGNYFQNNFEPDSVLTSNSGIIANERLPDGSPKPLRDGYKNNIDNYYFRGKIEKDKLSINFTSWQKKEGLGSEVPGYEYFANEEGLDYKILHRGKSFNLGYKVDVSKKITAQSRMYFLNNSVLPETGFTYTWGYQSVDNGTDTATTDKKKQYSSEGFLIGIDQQVNAEISKKNHLLVGFQIEQKIREYFSIQFVEGVPIPDIELDSTPNNLRPRNLYISKNGAIFFNDEQKIANHTTINLGFRYDYDEFYGNIINPKVALIRSKDRGFNYKLLLGQGYRPPSIFELYDEWRGNRLLIPEVIKTGEIELRYKGNNFVVVSNFFYNQIENIIGIAANPDTSAVPIGSAGQHIDYYQNMGTNAFLGISVSGNIYVNNNIYIYGNYQFLGNGENGGNLDNVAAHKVNMGINSLFFNKLNINLRSNWVGKTKAPISNRYFYEKTPESIQEVGYDYVTEENPDGYLEGFMLFNATITGKNLTKKDKFKLEPYIIVKNLLNKKYVQMGRQSGNGTRPVDAIQTQIRNPVGFIPAYHPQPGIQIMVGVKFIFI